MVAEWVSYRVPELVANGFLQVANKGVHQEEWAGLYPQGPIPSNLLP